MTLKTVEICIPDVCLKDLNCGVLVKRHSVDNQLDGSLELGHVAKDL